MALAYLTDPNIQFVTRNGVPAAYGFIRVFYDGTDDAALTYSNFDGAVNPDIIVLDNNGRAVIIATVDVAYRLEVYDRDGNLRWTCVNLKPIAPSPTDATVKYTPQTKNDNEKLQARLNIGAAALLSLAPAFNTSTDYDENDVVVYGGKLYIFDTPHAAGAWTDSDAHETNLMEVLAMAGGTPEKPTTIISAPLYVGGNSAQLDIYTYANNNHSNIVSFTGQCFLDFRPNAGMVTNPNDGNALDVVSFSKEKKLRIKRARITAQGSQGIGAANGQKAAQFLLRGYKIDGVAVQSMDYFCLAIDNYNEWQDINATYDVAKSGEFSAPSFDLKIVENVDDAVSKLTVDDYNLQRAYVGQKLQAWLELEVESDSIV